MRFWRVGRMGKIFVAILAEVYSKEARQLLSVADSDIFLGRRPQTYGGFARGTNLICFSISHVNFFGEAKVYSQTGWGP